MTSPVLLFFGKFHFFEAADLMVDQEEPEAVSEVVMRLVKQSLQPEVGNVDESQAQMMSRKFMKIPETFVLSFQKCGLSWFFWWIMRRYFWMFVDWIHPPVRHANVSIWLSLRFSQKTTFSVLICSDIYIIQRNNGEVPHLWVPGRVIY